MVGRFRDRTSSLGTRVRKRSANWAHMNTTRRAGDAPGVPVPAPSPERYFSARSYKEESSTLWCCLRYRTACSAASRRLSTRECFFTWMGGIPGAEVREMTIKTLSGSEFGMRARVYVLATRRHGKRAPDP